MYVVDGDNVANARKTLGHPMVENLDLILGTWPEDEVLIICSAWLWRKINDRRRLDTFNLRRKSNSITSTI